MVLLYLLLFALLGTLSMADSYCEEKHVTVTVYQTVCEDENGHLSPGLSTLYTDSANTAKDHSSLSMNSQSYQAASYSSSYGSSSYSSDVNANSKSWYSPIAGDASSASYSEGYQFPTLSIPTPPPSISVAPSDHLLPCVHQDFNTKAIGNLQPSKECTMYYEATGSSIQNAAAFLTFTELVYNVVVLEHIDAISIPSCDGTTLTITFSDSNAFSYASSAWPAEISNGLVFITNCPSCGSGYPAERAWLLINSIQVSHSTMTMTCGYTEIALQDASKIIEVNFGNNTRSGSSNHQSTSSTSFSTISSGSLVSSSSSTTSFSRSLSSSSGSVASSVNVVASSTSSNIVSPTLNPVTDLDFDVDLDDQIGYLVPNSSGFWAQLLPGVSNVTTAQFGSPQRRVKRAFDVVAIGNSLVSSASNAISNGFTALQNTVTDAVNNASTAFTNAVSAATQAAIALVNSLSPFSLGPWPFNLSPSNSANTPFGPGTVLAKGNKNITSNGIVTGSLTAYCVGCGVSGSFSLKGNFIFDVQQGVITAFLDLNGNIQGQLVFALVGEIVASDQWSKNLITQGLPGLSITNVISVGPFITVDVGATATFTLQGGIEYGWVLNWPAIDASIDLVNPAGTVQATGLNPIVKTQVDFSETASLSASVFGTVALRFGINILSGKYTADVGLVNKPEGDLHAIQQIYSHNQLKALKDGDVVCGGVGADFELIDSVYIEAEIGGAKKKQNTTKTYPLTSWTLFSTSTCFGQNSTISHRSSSTSSTSSSSTASSAVPSYCGILQDSGNDEPDNDGDEVTTCVTGSDTTLLVSTFAPKTTTSSSTADFTPSSCDPGLDPTAFGACESGVEAQIQAYEASVFAAGLKKRALAARTPAPVITPAPVLPKPRTVDKEIQVKRDTPITQTSIFALTNTSMALFWADDGNLILDGDSSHAVFSSINNYVIGDSTGQRFLHLYADTLASLGVSRLRLATLDAMPLQSVLVTLVPITVTQGESAYVAVTSDGQVYWLVTCLLDAQMPKVFLAKNITAGAATLMDQSLATTLTGGNVTSCGYVPWGVVG